jgi:hypothetical protein
LLEIVAGIFQHFILLGKGNFAVASQICTCKELKPGLIFRDGVPQLACIVILSVYGAVTIDLSLSALIS